MYGFLSGAALVCAAAFVVALAIGFRRARAKCRRAAQQEEAIRQFTLRREHLEAAFLTAASGTGRPRGLSWADCEFNNDVAFARDRESDKLQALVGITIRFEAIPGGGMEEVEAVSDLRAATAVFRYEDERWQTDGRAVFNLNPSETIRRFQNKLEVSE